MEGVGQWVDGHRETKARHEFEELACAAILFVRPAVEVAAHDDWPAASGFKRVCDSHGQVVDVMLWPEVEREEVDPAQLAVQVVEAGRDELERGRPSVPSDQAT